MKSILILLSLLCINVYANTNKITTYDTKILRVIDGDTLAIEAFYLPEPLKKELLLRIYGIDTPEKSARAKCSLEKNKGILAHQFVKSLIQKSKTVKVIFIDWDKYGGRVLGDIILDGVSLRNQLLEKGHAVKYQGGIKPNWCKN